ncbi:hypothetical protein [Bartonella sp. AP152HLJHH]
MCISDHNPPLKALRIYMRAMTERVVTACLEKMTVTTQTDLIDF